MSCPTDGVLRARLDGQLDPLQSREIEAPGVAFVPRCTDHHVENIGDRPLEYIYVSIWPGQIPPQDGLTWREAGSVLGCTSANVAYHMRRIRSQYAAWQEETGGRAERGL